MTEPAQNPNVDPILAEQHQALMDADAAWNTAASFQNKDLTPEGLQKARDKMIADARTQAATVTTAAASKAKAEAETAAKAIESFKMPTELDDAALTRAEIAWRNDVQPYLPKPYENGSVRASEWQKLISSAGPEELIAIQRFAPAYLRRTLKLGADDAIEGLAELVANRWTQAHPDEKARSAFAAHAKASGRAQTAQQIAAQAESVQTPQQLAWLAFNAKQAAWAK